MPAATIVQGRPSAGLSLVSCASSALALREPSLVAGGWPARQPRAEQRRGLCELLGAEIRDDQRVLEDLALRVTAADPGQLDNRRFENSSGFCIVAAGEGGCSGAQCGRYLSGRQATVRYKPTKSGEALLQPTGITRRRFGKAGVEIREGEAGSGKVPARMRGDLGPLMLERRCQRQRNDAESASDSIGADCATDGRILSR